MQCVGDLTHILTLWFCLSRNAWKATGSGSILGRNSQKSMSWHIWSVKPLYVDFSESLVRHGHTLARPVQQKVKKRTTQIRFIPHVTEIDSGACGKICPFLCVCVLCTRVFDLRIVIFDVFFERKRRWQQWMFLDPMWSFAAGHVCVCVSQEWTWASLVAKPCNAFLNSSIFKLMLWLDPVSSVSRLLPSTLYPVSLEKLFSFIAL